MGQRRNQKEIKKYFETNKNIQTYWMQLKQCIEEICSCKYLYKKDLISITSFHLKKLEKTEQTFFLTAEKFY